MIMKGESKEVREPAPTTGEENGLPKNPPSYDHATAGAGPSSRSSLPQEVPAAAADATNGETNLHYQHPTTGRAAFPPGHLEILCPAGPGGHIYTRRFGVAGIITAVLLFPFGVILCMLDRRVACMRCGQIIEDGITC
ncbi:hypothetical protein M0805_006944 [Coniferiporia weirii]|nr:hypothetical protein M0805_006944 [Coniferiporia weirii]